MCTGKGLIHCVGSATTLAFWETIWLLDPCAAVILQVLVWWCGSPTAPFVQSQCCVVEFALGFVKPSCGLCGSYLLPLSSCFKARRMFMRFSSPKVIEFSSPIRMTGKHTGTVCSVPNTCCTLGCRGELLGCKE